MVHANPFDYNLWMYQIAHFSTYFRIIAIDIRGYGRSDKPTTPFSLKDMADDVLGVCGDEGVKEAILGGVSVGSGMAILLGLDHPEMINQMTTPDELRGQMSSINSIFTSSGPQLGQFESGLVAAWLGAQLSALTGGLASLAIVALVAIGFPQVQRFRILQR